MKHAVPSRILFVGAVLFSSLSLQARSPQIPPGFPTNGTISCKVEYSEQVEGNFNSVEGTVSMKIKKGTRDGHFEVKDIKDWKQKFDTKQMPKTVNDPHSISFHTFDGKDLNLVAIVVKTDAKGEVVSFSKAHTGNSSNKAVIDANIYTPAEDQSLTLVAFCKYTPE